MAGGREWPISGEVQAEFAQPFYGMVSVVRVFGVGEVDNNCGPSQFLFLPLRFSASAGRAEEIWAFAQPLCFVVGVGKPGFGMSYSCALPLRP